MVRAELDEALAEKRARGEIQDHLPGLRDGFAGAGIIYASMLDAFASLGTPILLQPPFDMSGRIVFGAGVIERDVQRNAAAAAFVSYLIEAEGQERLVTSGFLPRERALRNLQAMK